MLAYLSAKVVLKQIVLGPCVLAMIFGWNKLWLRELQELPSKYQNDALHTLLKEATGRPLLYIIHPRSTTKYLVEAPTIAAGKSLAMMMTAFVALVSHGFTHRFGVA